MADFHENLKRIMMEQGLTQTELAKRMNTTQQTVSRWVYGQRQPDYDVLLRLCFVLNEEPNEMLGFNRQELKLNEKDEKLIRERELKRERQVYCEQVVNSLKVKVKAFKNWDMKHPTKQQFAQLGQISWEVLMDAIKWEQEHKM